jgi:hypothetical protein
VAAAITHANTYTAQRGVSLSWSHHIVISMPILTDRCGPQAAPGTGWSIVRFSIGFIGILVPNPALDSMRAFFNRYYLIKPPDLMLIEWMHGDWPGGIRVPTGTNGKRALSALPLVGNNAAFALSFIEDLSTYMMHCAC